MAIAVVGLLSVTGRLSLGFLTNWDDPTFLRCANSVVHSETLSCVILQRLISSKPSSCYIFSSSRSSLVSEKKFGSEQNFMAGDTAYMTFF
jgi:hypothetical protein